MSHCDCTLSVFAKVAVAGKVQLEAKGEPISQQYCHCKSCRQYHCAPFAARFCSRPVTSRLKVGKINVSRSTTRQTAPGCHAARAAPLWSTYRLLTLKCGALFLCCLRSWSSTPGVTYGGTREWSSIPWMTSPNMMLGDQCDDSAWSSCGWVAQVLAMLAMYGTPFCACCHSLSYDRELCHQLVVCLMP